MGSKKAALLVLLLALEGLAATGAARQHLRAHPLSGMETPRKPLAANYLASFCDFDSADRPFCDWTQPQDSHGSLWLRDLGQKPGQSPGPPQGDIARREYYIHPGAGGSARLESPDLDPAGAELCLRFLYYLYTLDKETQLTVEIRDASGTVAPLWTRSGLQSSSWLSGAVTLPAQAQRPFKVVFKAKQVKAEDVELAVDSIFIQLGPCSPCVTKCDFDTPGDFCGWESQQEGDVTWEQWAGRGDVPGVGPTDDFSRPGFGSYMLLNPFNEGNRGSAFLKSPTFGSLGGCLVLSFYYTLHGISDDTALKVYAAAPGEELGVPLLTLSGDHGPHWRLGAANYTGRKNIQFVFEGTLVGNPGLAVDSVAISPCEEVFAACDFNNNTDPFCGWREPADNVIWIRTNQGTPTEDTGPPGDYPHGEGYYIFAEAGSLKPGESTSLSSRPFCINQEACVEFYYHMHSIVAVETQLRVLLEGPSGTALLLWNRTGTQSPNWLFGSVMVPYSGAQPSTVTFEVVRGSNAYLDVALDNVSVHRGQCAEPPATPVPPSTSSIASSTAGGPVVTVPPEQPTVSRPTTVSSSSPTTFNASSTTTTKATVTKPHPTTLSSTGDSAQPTRPVATTTVTPHSSASPGQGNQTTTGLPSSSQAPSYATPLSTQSSTPADPPQPPSTGQTSPHSPVTSSSVSTTVSGGSTSHGTVVPTRNESLATPTGPPSSPTTTTSGGDLGPTPPPSASSTIIPCHNYSTTPSHVSTTAPIDLSSSPTAATLPDITVPTRTASTPKLTTTLQPTTGIPNPSKPSTPSSVLTSSTTSKSSTSQGNVVPTRNESLATPTVAPSSPTTGTLPDITVPTRTASTPKLTTTLQPTTGFPNPSKPSTPSSVLTSSTTSKSPQPSGSTTTQPLPTDHVGTPKPTSKRPGIDQTTPGQPPDRALCTVSGDPHYTTYDGRLFHFMGNCTYLLTAACNATPGQPTFEVQTTNEHRGSNTQVSYLKSVSVAVHGTQIVLLKGRRVTVDGKRVTLPVSVAGGRVSARRSGTFVLVQTDFGLLVRFDGNHHADVSVPSSYVGELCGLCGNFNGQAADDNLMPNGTSAGADANRLGESWQVSNVGDASCTNSGDPGECDPDIAAEAQGPTSCGILTDPQGPFAPCHGKVPPQGAFENCIYDLCGTGGDTGLLCFALQSYADRCAQAGVTIAWRNSTFCPLNCPPGSNYTPCGPACPSTCTDPDARNGCPDLPCVEGCMCDQGFVLSGDHCVPLNQCGCTDANGHYHVVGESWMGNLDCTQRCSCAAGNQITCEEWSCTPVQECQPVEGLLGCQDTGVATCHVAGDPHYFTFDGKMVSFMGTCTYTLVAVCQHDPRLPDFNITAKNEERGQPEASYLRLVTVKLEGVTITLQKGRRVLIDGQHVRTPVEGRIPGVSITSRGIYVVIETNFGLVVKFDGNHHLEIQLPGTYFGKVCGMCGNFNNQSTDDYLMPNGHLAANDTQFGNSWKAPSDADPGCQPDDRLDLHPNCSRQELERLHVLCLEIMAPKYQPCHSIIDPKLFFQNCLYDMCEYQGMTSVLCDNIQAYVEACKSQGVTSISWRNSTFCPLPCRPNSHFTECASPCPATCSNLYAPAYCRHPTPCVEGCACDRGHVLSDYTCVPMQECGCLDSQQEYHNAGDSWVTSNCQKRCTCLGSGEIQCQPFHCLPGSQCSISTDGSRYCRPTIFHQCVVSGDPHYRTFDNFVHHFQGRCTYTLTRTLGRVPEELEPLSVAGRNYRRSPLQRVSFLREVYVEVLGHRITLMQGRKMAVNGVTVTPPYSPRDGLQIIQRGRSLFVQTSFGFSVSFDGKNAAEIVLPSTYQQRVGGLCGNYDGRRNNEYMKPDGTVTRSLNTFGNSWKVSAQRRALDGGRGNLSPARVRREEPAEEPESGFEVDCTPEQLAFVNGTTVCGALAAPAGPFSACHGVVSPAPFQESCVYDMCALFNDTELLCQDFQAYAQLCQEEGVDLGLWRQKTGCKIQCPAHTSYQPCMSACPATCANLAAPSTCEAPCVEGCASAPGYVLSGLVSVPYSQCGCSSNGQYYQINQTFMTEDCSQRCACRLTEVLECSPAGCSEGEICAVANYVHGCFRDSPCLSTPCQNEGTCQETSGGFVCLCLEGYIGLFCEEAPLDDVSPAPPTPSAATAAATAATTTTRSLGVSSTSQALPGGTLTTKPGDTEDSNLMNILLGVFISLAIVLLLTLIIVCACRHRNKRKMDEDRVAVLSAPASVGVSHPPSSRITPL